MSTSTPSVRTAGRSDLPNLAVLGLGLGYSLSHYLQSLGHRVTGVDIDERAFETPRLDKEMVDWIAAHQGEYPTPEFTVEYSRVREADYILVFVATPLREGRLSLDYVRASMKSAIAANPGATYLVMSTLPIGGMAELHSTFPAQRMFYTPPMVKKHQFLSTYINPPSHWQLVGHQGDEPQDVIELYKSWQGPVRKIISVREDIAELAKLSTNMMMTTKIVMANAIRDWIGDEGSARAVCEIVGLDPRVGSACFVPGGPAAGPCFPRDVTELQLATPPDSDLHRLLVIINDVNHTSENLPP